jgi:allantoinase
MHDVPRTVIAHGTVVTDYAVLDAHMVIDGETVTAVTDDDGVIATADEVIDARGRHVLPGAIDPHAHFEDPGHTEREDFTTGTSSAAAGGITTVIEHPLTYPPVTTVDLYVDKREMAGTKVVVDFGLWGALTSLSLEHMEGQWAQGAGGFKAFMPISDPSYPNVSDDEMLTGMRIAAALGGLVLVHAESDSLLRANIARLKAAGRTDTLAHYESRPPFTEEEAVHRVVYLAAHAGARLQVVHTSSPVSIDHITAARAAGQPVTAEICPHHLLLDLDDGIRLGPFGVCAPPLRERSLVEGQWERVLDGRIHSLVSDHAAYTLEEKRRGYDDIFETPLGCQVMQEAIPLVLSEALNRGMALDAFVRFCSTNTARTLGLHPRKGTLLPGSDADLVIWDLDAPWTVQAAAQQFSKNPWSPFEGMAARARVLRTLVRGRTVYADGEITAEPGYGRFLARAGAPAGS